jgi:hypothetical protein
MDHGFDEETLFFVALVSFDEDETDHRLPADIYAVGFQEIVDLNASNIMAARYGYYWEA